MLYEKYKCFKSIFSCNIIFYHYGINSQNEFIKYKYFIENKHFIGNKHFVAVNFICRHKKNL